MTDAVVEPKAQSLFKKAKREQVYLKVGLAGPSGSGKTYSSLLLAKGLMGSLDKVAVLDTENGSANLYDHLGGYSVLPMSPPYHPDRFCKAIDLSIKEGFECLIIDSLSHEWFAEGGCLDLHSKFGGQFQHWAKVTPLHDGFINKILQAPIHVLGTLRKKQDYVMSEVNGRTKVEKVGLKEVQRNDMEYDLSLVFDIDIHHVATSSKDRTNLFPNTAPFKITEETGKILRDWSQGKKQKEKL